MTIGGKLATMERDCQALVGQLNAQSNYREGLQTVANVRLQLEQGDSSVADQEFPAKT